MQSPDINLTRAQSRVFNSKARFRALVAGRRFGKTYLSIPELLRKTWNKPGALAWYLAPTYRQAKQIAWRELKQRAAPYIVGRPNETDLSLTLLSGGAIALRGAENYDALRGPGLDFAVMDEYADMKPVVWTEVIRPMLSDRLGAALFIGTPKGMNHFYELYQRAKTAPDWAAFQYTTLDGGNVPASELDAARLDMDAKTFAQEYMGSFENFAGRCYYAFERDSNLKISEYVPSRGAIAWSMDFNVDPMSSVITQTEETTTREEMMMGRRSSILHVIDEIILPNSNTLEACEEFGRRAAPWVQRQGRIAVEVYGDAAGGARSTAGKSDYQIVREYFRVHPEFQVSYHVPAANPAVKDRVNAMNSLLRSASGRVRMFVDPRCKRLTADLEQVAWKADANGNLTGEMDKKNPLLTHVSDALGYQVEKAFGLRMAGGPRSNVIV